MATNNELRVKNGSVYSFTKSAFLKLLLLPFAFLIFSFNSASAQTLSTQETAPPPLKILSKGEKDQLDAEADIKKRTKLALDLMEGRLKKAEELDTQNNFIGMYDELGKFHALIDYTLKFLYRNNNNSGKALNNFKRFDIGLRAFPPRLEVVRRNLPIRYEYYVRNLIRNIRDTRTKAVETFFDDTVLPNAVSNN